MKSFILSQKCLLKHILLLLVFLAYGVSSFAQNHSYNDEDTIEIDGVRYHLWYYKAQYDWQTSTYIAFVEAFTDSREEIVIPDTIINGTRKYKVRGMHYYPRSWSSTKTLSSNAVKTIRFKGAIVLYPDATIPTFNCPNLKTLYFEGPSPILSGNYEDYFLAPGKKAITVYLSDKTESEITAMTTNDAVWSDFLAVRHLSNTYVKRNVNLSINHAKVEIGSDTYVRSANMWPRTRKTPCAWL